MGWHRNTPPEYQNGVTTGDARALAARLPDESVDLVLCDPVWWYVHDYAWLGWLAARVLRAGGSLVAQVGTDWRFDAEAALRMSGLTPRPLIIETFTGGHFQRWKHRSVGAWHPFLWFTKGERQSAAWVRDLITGQGRDKSVHAWGDTPATYIHAIDRLTAPGDVVLDPFTGGGTVPAVCKHTGRNFIAFEIDPETAQIARERVRLTPEPLLIVDAPEPQMALGME